MEQTRPAATSARDRDGPVYGGGAATGRGAAVSCGEDGCARGEAVELCVDWRGRVGPGWGA